MLSDDITSLIGFGCEAVLYGMYCVLFLTSVWLTFGRVGPLYANKFIASANILLFAVCTTHFGITFNGFYNILGSTGVEGYGNGTPAALGANVLISVADWIGEMILIYRCWAIWGRNYHVVALPFLASTIALACFCAAIHLVLGEDPTAPQPPPSIAPLVLAAYILPLCANFILTALIAGRIWFMSRGATVYSVSSMEGRLSLAFRAAIIIVESGFLYFVVQVIYLTVFALHNTADETMSLIAVQIYGIAPTLIVIQVGLGLTSEDTTKYTSGGTLSFVIRSEPRSTTAPAGTSDYLSSGTRIQSDGNSIMTSGSKMEFEENPDIQPRRRKEEVEVV